MSIDMSQFHDTFFEESHEHLDELERILMELDLENPDPSDLDSIFRAAHSIKGGSGIFGFEALGSVTHVMENLLDQVRGGQMELRKDMVDLLLTTSDTLRSILQSYRHDEPIDWIAANKTTEALENALKSQSGGPDKSDQAETEGYGLYESPVTPENEPGYGIFAEDEGEQSSAESTDDGFGFFDDPSPNFSGSDDSDDSAGFGFFDDDDSKAADAEDKPESAASKASADYLSELLGESDEGEAKSTAKERPVKAVVPSRQKLEPKHEKQPPQKAAPGPDTRPGKKSAAVADTTAQKGNPQRESGSIRVDIGKVDQLVNLVGELVITQSMLGMIGEEVEGSVGERLHEVLSELERNTRELQESVMSVRMLPVSFVFNRFPRVVRDLAGRMNKSIDLQLEGGETEMDKSMIEKLVDPLTHLVRNSIDHGVERPEIRRQKGKPEKGVVVLRAIQKGGNIVIEVEDDGAGLNRQKILEKAAERGLPAPDSLSDSEVWRLILEPGFSTAEEVTDVSGRGVGMDVVKRNIENLGGRLEIESFPGEGSRFTVQLPLTLAIIDGMGVKVGDQSFILPLVSIVESMRPDPANVKTLAGNDFLISVRDQYWPVIPLHKVMEATPEHTHPARGIVVLIETGRKRFALLVDELLGQQQVVIKSLEQNYRRVHGVAGATIMGDGNVALILDVESLAEDVKQSKPEEGLAV